MYMISYNIFFFQCFIIYLQNCTIWNLLMDELGIQNGLLNQNFWKLFWDSNEQNIFCNSYMCVKKNYCCLFSLNWCTYTGYTVFRIIFKSYRKFALLFLWISEVYVWKKYRVHTVAVIATHCVSIAILCC